MTTIERLPKPKEEHIRNGATVRRGYTATNAGRLLEEQLAAVSRGQATVQAPEPLYYAVIQREPDGRLPALPDSLAPKDVQADGFSLTANESGVYILSRHPRGVLYGWQKWQQMVEDGQIVAAEVIDYPDTPWRAFHLDMRYGFPTFERLLTIVDELSVARYNVFLLEYENRFPFSTNPDVADAAHLQPEQVARLQEYAAERYIEIIPLQQTIGHLEYLLKRPAYTHLREVREQPETAAAYSLNPLGFKHINAIDEICASNEDAYRVVEGMLDDIIAAHPHSRYIHIGCDEAWNLLSCPVCKEKFGADGKNRLYLTHINRMAARVLAAGKRPIIWDDMLRQFTDEELEQLDKRVVIMIWLYYESNYALAKKLVKRFRTAGFTVLGAAAAKCSEGPEPQYLDMPWYELRLGNVDMWGRLCAEEALDGFCMTVWSNYSGTIAPPHPFFDTIWYPVLFAAEKLWNTAAVREGFDRRFAASFFGVEMEELFHGGMQARCARMEQVAETAKRHVYEAKVLHVMELLSLYRLKSLAVGRELYKLHMPVTEAEKTIVRRRVEEVQAFREELKPLVHKVVATYYTTQDAEVFVRSRFDADEALYAAFGGNNS